MLPRPRRHQLGQGVGADAGQAGRRLAPPLPREIERIALETGGGALGKDVVEACVLLAC